MAVHRYPIRAVVLINIAIYLYGNTLALIYYIENEIKLEQININYKWGLNGVLCA